MTIYKSSAPLHAQVRELIRRQAMSGEIVDENGRLRTETELVKHFGVSRVTIRNAIAPLVEEGMFDRTRGRGTFLRTGQREQWMGRLLGFQELVEEAGHTPGARIIASGMIPAPEGVGDALKERAVWQLRRVRFADAVPVAVEHAYYPPDIGLALESRDLVTIMVYRVFESDLGLTIRHGSQTISACMSGPRERAELELPEPTALISMERLIVSSDGRPVELLRSVYRPDRFQFTINLTRRLFSDAESEPAP